MEKLKLEIKGMHCTSCEKIIGMELKDLKGIENIKISNKKGIGEMDIDPSKVTVEEILKAIKNAGYEAKAWNKIKGAESKGLTVEKSIVSPDKQFKIKFSANIEAEGVTSPATIMSMFNSLTAGGTPNSNVQMAAPQSHNADNHAGHHEGHSANKMVSLSLSGMHCASCANIIERSLKKVEGVNTANVNFASEKALVSFDESKADTPKLIEAVKKAGYKAEEIDKNNPKYESEKREKENKALWRKFIFSLVLSLPMFYFMMIDFFGWLPGGAILPPYFAIVSLILTTPVQFIVGAGFYKGMWSSLRMKTFNMDSLIAIGTSTAYFYSLINYILYYVQNKSFIGLEGMKIPELYFETAAFLLTFVVLGKWLEARAKGRTSDAIRKLMGLQAKTARVIRNGKTVDIPVEELPMEISFW
jgi:Cu+-exporting ATPase